MSDPSVVDSVREKYAAVAASTLSSEHAGVHAVAEAFGYSPEELASIPAEANMGLSCGNPTATAHLKPGEVVVDLGCGGGLDVLLAAPRVGPAGKAYGMMLVTARPDAPRGYANATFVGRATVDLRFERRSDGTASWQVVDRRGSLLVVGAGAPNDVGGGTGLESLEYELLRRAPGRLARAARIGLGLD